MNPISAFAIYFIIWWVSLFAVLPIGLKTQGEVGSITPGSHESAPQRPRFLFILCLTTLISCIIFVCFYWFTISKGLRFDDLRQYLPAFMTPPAP